VTLSEFLAARLDEDEYHANVAQLRAKSPWSTSETPEAGPPGAVSLYDAADDNFAIIRGSYLADYLKRLDPARVLREVEAKRAVLADRWGGPDHQDMWEHVVQLLATVWRDHPDYDPSWKPEP
jgi:hypothetical protein